MSGSFGRGVRVGCELLERADFRSVIASQFSLQSFLLNGVCSVEAFDSRFGSVIVGGPPYANMSRRS